MDDRRLDDITRAFAARRSRRSLLKGMLGSAVGGTLGTMGRAGAAGPAGKVGICHVTGSGSYRYIEVSANAVPAHERHGDIIAPKFSSDPTNCGGCGVSCPAPPENGMAVCVDGGCNVVCNAGYRLDGAGGCVAICDAGFTLCGDTCIDTTSDPNNCGGCGIGCASDTTCSAGACVQPCVVNPGLCTGAQVCDPVAGCSCASYAWSSNQSCFDRRSGMSGCAVATTGGIAGAVTDAASCTWSCQNAGVAICEDGLGCWCSSD